MRTGLMIFGIVFLVLGGLMYFVPGQSVAAQTTIAADGGIDTKTSTASVIIPTQWAYATAIIGAILLLLGFVIPGPRIVIKDESDKESYKTIETKEDIEIGNGNKRRIVRERVEKHSGKRDIA